MKSKLRIWAEEIWSCIVIGVTAFLFLFAVFAWVVSLMLTVAVSPWCLCLLPVWALSVLVLKKLLKYINRESGVQNEQAEIPMVGICEEHDSEIP